MRVELRETAEQTLLVWVGDTGCGFPEDLDLRVTDCPGLQLVCALAEKLQGTIALERGGGTHFLIPLPLAERTTFLSDKSRKLYNWLKKAGDIP